MDKDLIAKLAHAAGLDKALAEFPDDVAMAAEQALGNQGAIAYPDGPGRGTLAADARGDRAVSELHWLTAAEATRQFAARKLSPVELLTALLARIERLDPKLHAFIRLDADAAMDGGARSRDARSPPGACAGRCTACRSASRTSSMSPACRRRAIRRSCSTTSPRPTRR